MNHDIIAGDWEQLKGKIKATWGKITDNDLTVMKGKAQEVIGKIQERYGYSKERAEEEWKKLNASEKSCNDKSKKNSCCN